MKRARTSRYGTFQYRYRPSSDVLIFTSIRDRYPRSSEAHEVFLEMLNILCWAEKTRDNLNTKESQELVDNFISAIKAELHRKKAAIDEEETEQPSSSEPSSA